MFAMLRPWPQRPPKPLVEDELESLSRELGGLSLLGEKPGVEGACERGTIDQLPILLDNEHIPRSGTADTDTSTSQPPSLVSESSNESLGPRTPPPMQAIPLSRKGHPSEFDVSASCFRPSTRPTNTPAQPVALHSHSENPERKDEQAPQLQHPSPSRTHSQVSSTRNTSFNVASPENDLQGCQLEIATCSPRPTIAELLEEKLRLRRELNVLRQYSEEQYGKKLKEQARMTSSAPPSPIERLPMDIEAVEYISQPISPRTSPRHSPRASPTNRSHDWGQHQSPFQTPKPQTEDISYFERATTPRRKSPQHMPVYEARRATRPQRAVSFADTPQYSTLEAPGRPVSYRQEPSVSPTKKFVQVVPVSRVASRAPEPPRGLALLPCPRSYPVSGYRDWYTISGLEYLNICPSCMAQIGNSKFQEFLVPSINNTNIRRRCSFSEPWTRLAWIQTIKKGYDSLEMLYEITRPSGMTCPGRRLSTQVWHRIIDHETGMDVPKFAACSACVRNLRLLMPPLQQTFRRQAVLQEKICDLAVDSPRFVQYIDLLDAAANQCEARNYEYPDNSRFVNYFERKCNLRDCRRQRPVLGTWHYIPALPEFTVCEDCYDDVVRPLAAANKPIARRLATPPRLVRGTSPSRCREASCQLYSPRMRAKFRDAVMKDDYRMLETIALKRFDAERRYRDTEDELFLVPEVDRGYHWEEERRYNIEQWKACE